jgi:hypothetical protein
MPKHRYEKKIRNEDRKMESEGMNAKQEKFECDHVIMKFQYFLSSSLKGIEAVFPPVKRFELHEIHGHEAGHPFLTTATTSISYSSSFAARLCTPTSVLGGLLPSIHSE